MKLLVNTDGESREIEIKRDGRSVVAEIGGRRYELEVSTPEHGVYLLKNGTRVTELTVLPDGKGKFTVSSSASDHRISVSDPRKLGAAAAAGADAEGAAEIRTQMPGKVVRILVSEGDAVSSGDGVIVVEAMKMQNEMRSPKDGSVKKILKNEGDTVNAGDLLMVIE